MKSTNLTNYREGLRDGIPIALGYLAVSFTLGIAARNLHIRALPATLMSLVNFTSAGEFAALGIISAGAPYLEMIISQAIINLRYLLMSCALSQKLAPDASLFHRFWTGFFITDEIFGVSSGRPGHLNPFYTYGTASIAIPGWALGTCLGVILGTALPDRITLWHVPRRNHPSGQKRPHHRRTCCDLNAGKLSVHHDPGSFRHFLRYARHHPDCADIRSSSLFISNQGGSEQCRIIFTFILRLWSSSQH